MSSDIDGAMSTGAATYRNDDGGIGYVQTADDRDKASSDVGDIIDCLHDSLAVDLEGSYRSKENEKRK